MVRLFLCLGFVSGCGADDDAPAVIDRAECEAGGGVAANECVEDTRPIIAHLASGKACCTDRGLVTIDQCENMGATPVADRGDGSLDECPGDSRLIAHVIGFIEGGLCCTP